MKTATASETRTDRHIGESGTDEVTQPIRPIASFRPASLQRRSSRGSTSSSTSSLTGSNTSRPSSET